MPETRRMKTKVCLVGEAAVGKTSLIRRYVLDEFEDKYITTLARRSRRRSSPSTSRTGTSPCRWT